MIVVLADDFTGAAEIGMVGRKAGLRTTVVTTFGAATDTDLVVVDTNSRSATKAEALVRVRREAEVVAAAGVAHVYKKVDSVLRGHVAAELRLVLGVLDKHRALLVPTNPSFGQAIRAGEYTIRGEPLHQTRFAHDPEYPALTARVNDLLDPSGEFVPAHLESAVEENGADGLLGATGLPEAEVVVGGGESRAHLSWLARHVDAAVLPAGGSEFFAALLERWVGRAAGDGEGHADGGERAVDGQRRSVSSAHALFVLGSNSEYSRRLVGAAKDQGVPLETMPEALYTPAAPPEALAAWSSQTLARLEHHPCLLVAIDRDMPPPPRERLVSALPRHLAALARDVVSAYREAHPERPFNLFVEGGTTSSAVVREMGWTCLDVAGEEGRGVVTLRPCGIPPYTLTVKPGNYEWPDTTLQRLGVRL